MHVYCDTKRPLGQRLGGPGTCAGIFKKRVCVVFIERGVCGGGSWGVWIALVLGTQWYVGLNNEKFNNLPEEAQSQNLK